jgi:predicted XRE-type DNA-binding protein
MKTTEVSEFLKVSQSAVSKLVLRGEEIIRENAAIIDGIIRKS